MAPERVLVSFPGRAGDLLWSLPSVRAISEALGHPVDLQICGAFGGLTELLLAQPYLHSVWADPRWQLVPPEEWRAPRLPQDYDRVIHLGYRGWPKLPLPMEVYQTALQDPQTPPLAPLDLDRPWITVTPFAYAAHTAAVGFSDNHFELKYGLYTLLNRSLRPLFPLAAPGSRWALEGRVAPSSWLAAASLIAGATVFLGCNSGLHVLACALGIPCVIVEPMVDRHNPIFWPFGMDGRVRCVRGTDGQPTWDARHTADALREALAC